MKVFNTSRKNLVPGKRFQKYLLYAIGEIILVVIGILIGLRANGYAENVQNKKEVNHIFNIVASDLKADVKNIERITAIYKKKKPYFSLVLDPNTEVDRLKDCYTCQHLIVSLKLATLHDNGSILLANRDDIPTKQSELAEKIKLFYEQRNARFPALEQSVTETISYNLTYLRDNFNWYADWVTCDTCNKDCKDFFETKNPDFRNLTAHLQVLLYENYLPGLQNYKEYAKTLITAIEGS